MANQKITYLIGAGASYNALPLVKDFIAHPETKKATPLVRMSFFLSNFTGISGGPNQLPDTLKDVAGKLIEDLNWLNDACQMHATVDTFAKKLFLTRKDPQSAKDLRRLKGALSAYFMWEQCLSAPDNRYDTFYASVANNDSAGKVALPPNIRVISWNYDFQFEKAYSQYFESRRISDIQTKEGLNCFPSLAYSHSDDEYKSNGFSIVKLNGTAGLHRSGNTNREPSVLEEMWYKKGDRNDELQLAADILSIVQLYKQQQGPVESLLSFSWEYKPNEGAHKRHDIIGEALKIAKDTDILVIIGYSFPFFNREIDSQLFDSLFHPNGRLSQIYYQVPKEDSDFARQMLETVTGPKLDTSKLKMITETKDFYIPLNLQSKADETVDLLNNEIGRRIGGLANPIPQQELAMKVLNEFHENGLWTAEKQKDGSVTISKTKITDEQYNKAVKVLKGLNNDGFTKSEQSASDAKGAAEIKRLDRQHKD